ncbi:MAG: hypothetical protein P4L58_02430, partial [Candidatus Pacebacteria bacterium]|nr:hypothetical protein [Candidatus Paceibacterota bacterium]
MLVTTEGADEDEAKEDGQQSAVAQGEFGVAALLGRLKLFVVENSPHTATPESAHLNQAWPLRIPTTLPAPAFPPGLKPRLVPLDL